ncbi:hypothetical protein CCACVL1_22385 [Corchorus capsularis]|uniref:Uncharacterized protein n=1 Tax=Corchorus capsularis TaxID=210143 RepID=A0A1R3GZS6_COCAP|nr:hypothetical protein CCACVL1_22385 [Corchorus capsularis]
MESKKKAPPFVSQPPVTVGYNLQRPKRDPFLLSLFLSFLPKPKWNPTPTSPETSTIAPLLQRSTITVATGPKAIPFSSQSQNLKLQHLKLETQNLTH